MAEETWKIILSQEMGGGSGEAAGGGGAGNAGGGAETPNQRKNLFEDAGKVFGAIASVSGMLAILIRSIGGSTVASTFMEVIFKILGALWDLFLINFLPIFMVLVRWLLSLMPVVKALGESLQPLIELIAEKLEGLLTAVTEWIVPRLLEFAKALTALATTGDVSPLLAWGEKFFKDLFEIASKLFMDLINWVKEKGPEIVASIGKSVTIFADWLKTNGPTIINTIVSGIKIMQDTLAPLWNQLVTVLGPIFEEVFRPITDYFKTLGEWIKSNIFDPIWAWLMNKLFPWLLDMLTQFFTQAQREVSKMVGGIMAGIAAMSSWTNMFESDKHKMEDFANAQAAFAQNNPPEAIKVVPGKLDELKLGVNGIFTALPAFTLSLNANTAAMTTIAKNTGQTAQNTSTIALQGTGGGVGVNTAFEPHNNALRRQQDCGAPDGAASNSAQTSNVMYLARKKIYEELTGGQKYMGN